MMNYSKKHGLSVKYIIFILNLCFSYYMLGKVKLEDQMNLVQNTYQEVQVLQALLMKNPAQLLLKATNLSRYHFTCPPTVKFALNHSQMYLDHHLL